MGAAVGGCLSQRGLTVLWASAGRSPATADRAAAAGMRDAGSIGEMSGQADVILSVCPPHAALEVARSVAGFEGIYVDANAVSPATAREIGGRFVDGGIIGPPPLEPGTTRLYLAGEEADAVAALFQRTLLEPHVISDEPGAASALKMAYAAWTKGTAAMLIAIRAL